MGYRVFTDSQGTEWQAWDVVPQLADRRTSERRRRQMIRTAADRRALPDRRVTVGRRPVLSAGLDNGWLCFEAAVEKRRLTPIPGDWLRCPEPQLEQYCRQARPAVRNTPAVDISALVHRAG